MHVSHTGAMAGPYIYMGETCNHVAVVMYRVEILVRIARNNPPCTSNAKNIIEPKKIKDLDFSRKDFGQRRKKNRLL